MEKVWSRLANSFKRVIKSREKVWSGPSEQYYQKRTIGKLGDESERRKYYSKKSLE